MDLRHIIYVKDGNGCVLKLGESIINGRIVHHLGPMRDVQEKINLFKNAKHREDDIWIIAFPKSGTHWLYEIVGILRSGKLEPLDHYKDNTFFERVPFESIEATPSPRCLNTHIRPIYIPDGKLEQEKIIYILRNPKSVAVSYYHFLKGAKMTEYDGTFEGFFYLYMQGIEDLFGSWFENTIEWWNKLKNRKNALIVCYEDMKKDPVKYVQSISEFLGLERDVEFCTKTVELTAFEKMKSFSGKSADVVEQIGLKHVNRKDVQNPFVRKGVIDDWKNYFTVKMNEDFHKIYDEKMRDYPEITKMLQYE